MLNTEQVLQQAETFYRQGQVAQAIAVLKNAINTQPAFYAAWLLLSKYLFHSGYYEESLLVSNNAEQFDPFVDEFQSIQRHMQNSAFADVENIAMAMLKKQPGHPRAIFSLAHIASLTPTPEQGVDMLIVGLEHNPANLTLRFRLIEAYDFIGMYEDALNEARLCVRIQPSFPCYWRLISLLHKYGQNEELLEVCETAKNHTKANKQQLSQINLIRGEVLRILGDRESSEKVLNKSLSENPANSAAWWALADLKNYHFTDIEREQMQAVLDEPGLDNQIKSLAAFSLAKASESLGDWEKVMRLYKKANTLYKSAFNPAVLENEFKARIEAYTKQSTKVQSNDSSNKNVPIFIVGLPRSGSTLIEQILASHSQIQGTMEQPTMPAIEMEAQSQCYKNHQQSLFASIGMFTEDELSVLGQAYLNSGRLFRKERTDYFTDKNPFNFRHIGLIHKILPQSIIIDVRRNPLDCGYSLYKQYFSSGVDFSYDLKHIGTFYNAYLKLMEHWHTILPDRVYSLQFEELVKSPDEQIRLLLKHVGVEFEQACVDFHNTRREVRTASSEQVRTPINKKGIGAWRNVADYLEPLKEALGKETLERYQQYQE